MYFTEHMQLFTHTLADCVTSVTCTLSTYMAGRVVPVELTCETLHAI